MEVNKKILGKMLAQGRITQKEYDSGNVQQERIDMWASDIQILSPKKGAKPKYTIIEQLGLRQKQLEAFEENGSEIKMTYKEQERIEMIKHCKNQIKKLENLVGRYKQEEDLGQKKMVFCKTQQEEVIRHLKESKSITSYTAFSEYGILRLSAIIYNLRHDLNWKIKTGNVTKKNRYGNKVTFAKYTTEEE